MILVIETSLKRGSISVCEKGNVLGFKIFPVGTSVAMHFLDYLEDLLNEIKIDRKQFEKILVSVGPGSLTGIRIGISSAMGLSVSLGIECLGVSLLESLAFCAKSNKVLSAIKLNSGQYYLQKFEGGIKGSVELKNSDYLEKEKNLDDYSKIIYSDKDFILNYIDSNSWEKIELNISKYLYFYYFSTKEYKNFTEPFPIYLQNNDYKKLSN